MNFSFLEKLNPQGYLEVWKHYPDGTRELHYADKNVITSGMGATLAELMDAAETVSVENFQIVYFKAGSSGNNELQVSGTGDLSGPFTAVDYGPNSTMDIKIHNLIRDGAKTTGTGGANTFGVIPHAYIKRVSPTRCMWQIILDEQTANVGDETPARWIDEIGLFSKNPYREAVDASMLCAYRWFKPVYKTDAFTLVIRWIIDF